jgi:uncharacterized protein (DUF3820 family)
MTENKINKSWMSFKMPFGKYKGQTLAMVRIRDTGYVFWCAENLDHCPKEILQCIEYINRVDPYSAPYRTIKGVERNGD